MSSKFQFFNNRYYPKAISNTKEFSASISCCDDSLGKPNWHKWPDEKPEFENHRIVPYLCFLDFYGYMVLLYNCVTEQWGDYNDNTYTPIAWMELPEKPKFD